MSLAGYIRGNGGEGGYLLYYDSAPVSDRTLRYILLLPSLGRFLGGFTFRKYLATLRCVFCL